MTTAEMKIKALAPWFGGKRSMAQRIVAELGEHRAYWEPMAGGFSILFNKPHVAHETLNDLHGDIINLARVVQSDELAPRLFDRLNRTLVHEDLLADADQVVRFDEPEDGPGNLDRAVAFFVACWMGRNGEAGLLKSERGRTLALRFAPNGGAPGQRFAAAVESIPAYRGWTFVDCSKHKNLSSVCGEGAESPEVLIINGPSHTQEPPK